MMYCMKKCHTYVCIMDLVILVFGGLLQALGLWLTLRDPLFDIEDMASRKLKMAVFFVGVWAMMTSCVGLRFWTKIRRKRAGVAYLFMLSVSLAMQSLLVFSLAKQTALLNDLSTDPHCEKCDVAAKEMLSKTFQSFATRYNEKYNCRIKREYPQGGSMSPKSEVPMFVLTDSDRTCEDVQVKCAPDRKYAADFINKRCVAKAGNEEVFQTGCDRCLDTYYDTYIKDTMYEDQHPEMAALWQSDASLVFCRCFGRVMDTLGRHSDTILICLIIFLGLQAMLIIGVLYLMLCAPPKDSEDADELELM
eukprot:TRINITY_DN91386_c0_g1_i1.p1 TRINITY_DN91386_c0_g1~~TRINITY_DN91386_c0_g1_i1.p1  ORF type:complete len:306 (-),score=51.11 TRINITY_DN91386_c0_g1_i1:5-922(-)